MINKPVRTSDLALATFAALGLVASSALAQTTPVFDYSFPASWGGTGTAVIDQSTSLNNGLTQGTLSLSAAVPSGKTGQSINTAARGGIVTSGTQLLNNSTVFAAGGFTYDVWFRWNGTDSGSWGHIQKLVDYAGTESLQLVTANDGTASLQLVLSETVAISAPVSQNTWYNATVTFAADSMVGPDVSGTANLYLDRTLAGSVAALKDPDGDGLNRPIGIGMLAIPQASPLVFFYGEIYNPSVSLGVTLVPEPSTLTLAVLGGFALLAARRRAG